MNQRLTLTLFIWLLTLTSIQAKIFTIKIRDAVSGDAVAQAEIRVFQSSINAFSDSLGYAEIDVPRKYSYLVISHLGYKVYKIKLDKELNVTVELEPATIILDALVIQDHLKEDGLRALNQHLDRGNNTRYAYYQEGWGRLYNRIAAHIKQHLILQDSVSDLGKFQFEINEEGLLQNVRFITEQKYDQNIMMDALLQCNEWSVGLQNGTTYIQRFELKLLNYYEVFQIVDEPASPPGGYQGFYDYVGKKLRYPAQARRMGIEGKVYVQFVVNKEGAIENVKIVRGIGAGCDEEVLRVVRLSPNWSPPLQEGKPVKQRIMLPITFKLGGSTPEVAPQFPGGRTALNKYFQEHRRPVDIPLPINKTGDAVILNVQISKKGEPEKIEVIRSLGKEYDKEALRLAQEMPWWKPGTLYGKTKNISTTVGVYFGNISKEKQNNAQQYYDEGVNQFSKGDYQKALEAFKKAVENNPTDLTYYFSRGITHLELFQNKEGCQDLKRIRLLDSKSEEVYQKFCASE